jgi:hypothetical protein
MTSGAADRHSSGSTGSTLSRQLASYRRHRHHQHCRRHRHRRRHRPRPRQHFTARVAVAAARAAAARARATAITMVSAPLACTASSALATQQSLAAVAMVLGIGTIASPPRRRLHRLHRRRQRTILHWRLETPAALPARRSLPRRSARRLSPTSVSATTKAGLVLIQASLASAARGPGATPTVRCTSTQRRVARGGLI